MKKAALILIATAIVMTACTSRQNDEMVAQPTQPPQPVITIEPLPISPGQSPAATATSSPHTTGTPKTQTKTSALSITQLPSEYKSDETRDIQSVDTIVVHTLYNPKYPNDLSITHAKEVLDESQVSSHFVIARDGKIYQLVPENYQAWHAGESKMPAPDGRTGVNKFSLGIELIATEDSGITSAQYASLTNVVVDISNRLPIKNILGHADIAPGRKTDPWKFDWKTWQASLQAMSSKNFTFFH